MSEKLIRNKQGLTEDEFLKQYDPSIFERPSVTVDMLIFTVMDKEKENYRRLPEKCLKILMIKRGDHPYMGRWALPGGFVSVHESIDEAARRELKTETNVDNIYMEQLYTFGDVNRDPRTRVISCSYMALVDSSSLELKAGEDADEAKWFNVRYSVSEEGETQNEKLMKLELWSEDEKLSAVVKVTEELHGRVANSKRELVETKGIAFDHGMVIAYALERLRNKIEYTDIAFNLMSELFTLTELQQVYEVILDKELLAAAFRRKIADRVIETDEFTKDAGHRPSKLYRFNKEWGKN
jgi:8-oxo-dGTP diphosphatase